MRRPKTPKESLNEILLVLIRTFLNYYRLRTGKLNIELLENQKTANSDQLIVKFLEYTWGKNNKEDGYKIRLHNKSKVKIKDKISEVTSQSHFLGKRRRDNPNKPKQVMRWWVNYYYLAEIKKFLFELDEWFRRRIRMVFLKRWKRAKTKIKKLMKLGWDVGSAKRIGQSRKGIGAYRKQLK